MYIPYLIYDAVGKIVPKELLDTSLSQTFNLLKKHSVCKVQYDKVYL